MTTSLTDDLQSYLQEARESILRSLEGLSEYDARRPLTPSGSNILGIVKHLVGIEFGYLGDCVGRPPAARLPWYEDGSVWDGADMWVKPDESRAYIVDLYRTAWAHSDASFAELALDAPGYVSWWGDDHRNTTFGHLATRVVAETAHHAGHCDILRESVDGQGGTDSESVGDAAAWTAYVAAVQAAADPFKP